MSLTDEQLDALAERLYSAQRGEDSHWFELGPVQRFHFVEMAREAARWAEEQQGEVAWQYLSTMGAWLGADATNATRLESEGVPVRAIRVIATTTKEGA